MMFIINNLHAAPWSFPRTLAVAAATALGCIAPLSVQASAEQPGPRFVDLVDHPSQEANWDRFHALEDGLAAAFFTQCRDDGCRPRHLLWPLQLRCSVRVADATVVACIWVIGGSDLQVAASGRIDPDLRVWHCPLPMPWPVAVDAFHAALEVPDPLAVRLPGAGSTLLLGLKDCLATPGSAT